MTGSSKHLVILSSDDPTSPAPAPAPAPAALFLEEDSEAEVNDTVNHNEGQANDNVVQDVFEHNGVLTYAPYGFDGHYDGQEPEAPPFDYPEDYYDQQYHDDFDDAPPHAPTALAANATTGNLSVPVFSPVKANSNRDKFVAGPTKFEF